jgi:hypothetical protein
LYFLWSENKENKKEANQEQAFSNGVKIVTREGLPGWRFSFFTNMVQMIQLLKFNNKRCTCDHAGYLKERVGH